MRRRLRELDLRAKRHLVRVQLLRMLLRNRRRQVASGDQAVALALAAASVALAAAALATAALAPAAIAAAVAAAVTAPTVASAA